MCGFGGLGFITPTDDFVPAPKLCILPRTDDVSNQIVRVSPCLSGSPSLSLQGGWLRDCTPTHGVVVYLLSYLFPICPPNPLSPTSLPNRTQHRNPLNSISKMLLKGYMPYGDNIRSNSLEVQFRTLFITVTNYFLSRATPHQAPIEPNPALPHPTQPTSPQANLPPPLLPLPLWFNMLPPHVPGLLPPFPQLSSESHSNNHSAHHPHLTNKTPQLFAPIHPPAAFPALKIETTKESPALKNSPKGIPAALECRHLTETSGTVSSARVGSGENWNQLVQSLSARSQHWSLGK